MKTITTIGILAAALAATPLAAQQSGMAGMDHSQMQGMDHSKMMQPTAANPYGPAEMKMHEKMMSLPGPAHPNSNPTCDCTQTYKQPDHRSNMWE